jgi:hypothetical protein
MSETGAEEYGTKYLLTLQKKGKQTQQQQG